MGRSLLYGPLVLLTVFCLFTWILFGADAAHAMEAQSSISILPAKSPTSTVRAPSLRILPLGDSITFGYLSSNGNGYRKSLFDMLTINGTFVEYIGSIQSGNMTQNHNEGHPGAIITEIGAFAIPTLPQRPNVILLMAGTNDMVQSLGIPDSPRRLGVLIDQCHIACPDAVIMVAQLTPSTFDIIQTNINAFNPTIPTLVAARVMAGVKALVVDMSAYVSTVDLTDGIHPNDAGYNLMAQAWLEGFEAATAMGWITPPINLTALALPPASASTTQTSTPVLTPTSKSSVTSSTPSPIPTSTSTPTSTVANPNATSGVSRLRISLALMAIFSFAIIL